MRCLKRHILIMCNYVWHTMLTVNWPSIAARLMKHLREHENENLAFDLRLNQGPCTLQRRNLAANLRLTQGPCILEYLAVNLRQNPLPSRLLF